MSGYRALSEKKGVYSSLMKFSHNFDALWSVKNPENSMVSNHFSLVYHKEDNSLFWFSRMYEEKISEIAKVSAETGEVLIRMRKTNPKVTLGVWGEKTIVAESETFDENGNFYPSIINILNLDGTLFA